MRGYQYRSEGRKTIRSASVPQKAVHPRCHPSSDNDRARRLFAPHCVRTHTAHQFFREDRRRKRAEKGVRFEWTTKAASIRRFPPGQKQDIASRNGARAVHSIIWLLDCGPLLGRKAALSLTYPLRHLLRLAQFTALQLFSYFTERSLYIALCRCLAPVYADASSSSPERPFFGCRRVRMHSMRA